MTMKAIHTNWIVFECVWNISFGFFGWLESSANSSNNDSISVFAVSVSFLSEQFYLAVKYIWMKIYGQSVCYQFGELTSFFFVVGGVFLVCCRCCIVCVEYTVDIYVFVHFVYWYYVKFSFLFLLFLLLFDVLHPRAADIFRCACVGVCVCVFSCKCICVWLWHMQHTRKMTRNVCMKKIKSNK